MAQDQLPENVTFKCSYCGNLITAVCSPFHFTEVCPVCRGSVMIPRPKPNASGVIPLIAEGIPLKESGEWPAGHYAQPGAKGVSVNPPTPTNITESDLLPPNVPTPPISVRALQDSPPVDFKPELMAAFAPPPPEPEPVEPSTLPPASTTAPTRVANRMLRRSFVLGAQQPSENAETAAPSAADASTEPVATEPLVAECAIVPSSPAPAAHTSPPDESSHPVMSKSENASEKPPASDAHSERISWPVNITPTVMPSVPAPIAVCGPSSVEIPIPNFARSPDLHVHPTPETALVTAPFSKRAAMPKTEELSSPTATESVQAQIDHSTDATRAAATALAQSVESIAEKVVHPPTDSLTGDVHVGTPSPSSKMSIFNKASEGSSALSDAVNKVHAAHDALAGALPLTASFSGGAVPHTEPASAPVEPPESVAHLLSTATPPPSAAPVPITKVIENVAPWSVERNVEKPLPEPAHVETVPQHDAAPSRDFVPPPFKQVDASTVSEFGRAPNPKVDSTVKRMMKPLDPTHIVALAPGALPPPEIIAHKMPAPPAKPRTPIRWGLIAATLAIIASAGGWIYVSTMNSVALQKRRSGIDSLIADATHSMLKPDTNNVGSYAKIQEAASKAKSAQAELARTDGGEFEPEFKETRTAQIGSVLETAAKASQIELDFSKKDKDLATVKKSFEERQSLWKNEKKTEYVALRELLKEKQTQLAEFEASQKLAKLRERLADANAAYHEQKVEDAAKIADVILAAMKSDPIVQDQDLQKRAEILSERAARLDDAIKKTSAATGDNAVVNKKLLQSEIAKLDPANDDLKPLLARYTTLLGKVETDESAHFLKSSQRVIAAAEDLYQRGKIEAAANAAAHLLESVPPKVADQSADVIKRAQALVDHGKKAELAAQIRASGKDDKIAGAKKLLQSEIEKLGSPSAEVQPLIERMQALKAELSQDERAFKQKAQRDKKNAVGTDYALSTADAAEVLKKLKKFAELDEKVVPGELDFDGFTFELSGKEYKLCQRREAGNKPVLFLESGDNRIVIDPRHFENSDKAFRPRWHRAFYHAIALADAMQKAGVKSDDYWDSKEEAPFVSARRFDKQGNEFIFLGDRLYTGKAQEKTDQQKKIEDQFRAQSEALATAVDNDEIGRASCRERVCNGV